MRLSAYLLVSALLFWSSGPAQAQNTYVKITSADELTDGAYLIGTTSGDYVLGPQAKNNRTAIATSATNGSISAEVATLTTDSKPFEIYIFKLSNGNYILKDTLAQQYLHNPDYSGKNNYLRLTSEIIEWTIEVGTDGIATIKMAGVTGRTWLKKNQSSAIFACYASGQNDISLYKKQEAPATCGEVSNVTANTQATSVTLAWEAPDPAPASYTITISKDGNQVAQQDRSVAQFKYDGLTAGTTYEYSIVSNCSETLHSEAVTGTFTTKTAEMPALTVTSPENGHVFNTKEAGFAWSTTNFELGETKLIQIEFSGSGLTSPLKIYTTQNSYSGSFERGTYKAVFNLVTVTAGDPDNDTTIVEGTATERSFTVKPPYVEFASPEVSISGIQTIDCSTKAIVKGFLLEEDVTLTGSGNFSVSPSTLAKADVMSTDGAEITVTYNGQLTEETGKITATCGTDLTAELTVKATCEAMNEVENIAALRAGTKDSYYKLKGEVTLTAKDTYRNYKWIEDESGAILIDDATSLVTTSYEIGDGITGVYGKFSNYAGQLQLVMIGNLPEASSHGNTINPKVLTVKELTDGIDNYCSRLVRINNLTLSSATGKWESNTTTNASDGSGTIAIHTFVRNGNFIGKDKPEGTFDLIALAGVYNKAIQVSPRSIEDIIITEPTCGEVSEVNVNTQPTSATITWKAAEPTPQSYSITITEDGTDTPIAEVNRELTTYNCTGLKASTTYHYSIVANCSETLKGEAVTGTFTTKAENDPTLVISTPGNNHVFTSKEVSFSWTTTNFELGADKLVKITFSGEKLATDKVVYTDQNTYSLSLGSGNYTAVFNLANVTPKSEGEGNDTVPVANVTGQRIFSVDLPDVANPVFAPEATDLETATDVTLICTTDEATIYYSLNDAAFTEYTQAIKLETDGTYAFKAFAVKEDMDTSAIVSKTYTLTLPIEIEGEIVFDEPFDKITVTSDGTANIAGELDKYTNMPGWTGDNVYQGQGGCAKLGTSSKLGYLQTPAIDLSANEGKFMLSFEAKAFNNAKEKESIKLIVNGEEQTIEGLPKDKMKKFVFAFTSGTASSTIRFSAVEAGNNRFYLDNVRIYQVLPAVPTINVPATLALSTIQDQAVIQKVTVKGKLLENDVTVTCPTGNFTVSPATLPKADVMGENGAELTITFNGKKAADTVTVKFTSGSLEKEMTVTATATPITEVNTLADLQQGTQGQLYRIKGEVILTATDTYRNYKWLQDASAGIRIDDPNGLVSTTYQIGDGITGIVGQLGNYKGENQLVMVGNLPEASSHGNTINPIEVSVTDLEENMEKYAARVVKLKGLTLTNAEGNWEKEKDNEASDAEGNKINIYTFVRSGNFVGTAKPQGTFDLVALAGIFNNKIQVSPRTTEDIIAAGVEPEKDTVKTPVFTPASGSTIAMGSIITISCATDGAKIYYTTDGEIPTTQTNLYVDGIKMTEKTMAIQAIAVKEGMISSEIALATYTASNTAIEATDNLQATIYPNPNNGLFVVEVAEAVRMEIFNLSGLNLRTLELTAGKTEINLPQSGIYFIRLSNAQATVVKRVVVR